MLREYFCFFVSRAELFDCGAWIQYEPVESPVSRQRNLFRWEDR